MDRDISIIHYTNKNIPSRNELFKKYVPMSEFRQKSIKHGSFNIVFTYKSKKNNDKICIRMSKTPVIKKTYITNNKYNYEFITNNTLNINKNNNNGSIKKELELTQKNWIKASQLNLSPKLIYYGFYEIKQGDNYLLHQIIINEGYDTDLDTYYNDKTFQGFHNKQNENLTEDDIHIALKLIHLTNQISEKMGLICFDIKPANCVINLETKEVKLIDWDGDWCNEYTNYNKNIYTNNNINILNQIILANYFYYYNNWNILYTLIPKINNVELQIQIKEIYCENPTYVYIVNHYFKNLKKINSCTSRFNELYRRSTQLKKQSNGGYYNKRNTVNKINNNMSWLHGFDNRNRIISIFEDLLDYYKTIGYKNNNTVYFKIQSYEKAIKELKKIDNVSTINNIKHLNIGKKTIDKIDIILKTKSLPLHKELIKNKDKREIQALKAFQHIYGVGPEFSKKIYDSGIKNIETLKKKVKKKEIQLSDSQTLGLHYYNDLKTPIPRNEITKITNSLKRKFNKRSFNVELLNAGSYSMKKEYSNDIDYIIVFDPHTYNIQEVKNIFYSIVRVWVKGHLLNGTSKDIFLIQPFKANPVRHLDVGYVPKKEKYFYMLYFSSSRNFSKNIRLIASKKGYKLNEKGIFDRQSGKQIDFQPKSEKDIFDYLDIPYVKPENRK